MSELEELLRAKARQLLAEGQVQQVIGYERGTVPLRARPCFVRDPEQVERLVWNPHCENNLATYLHQADGKVAIVAKGCDARSIVNEIVERQVPRGDVVIIGVPCQGVVDRRKVEELLDGRDAFDGQITQGHLVIHGTDFEESVELQAVWNDSCATCRHRNPPVYDILIGELVEAEDGEDVFVAVRELEAKTADERWAYFSSEFSRCIRCYACRQACPSCYCPECFVDQTQPSWFAKSDELSDVMAFHLVRAYHVAGRCLDCGACARACPMGIDLRTLSRKLQKDVRELFDYEPGMDVEAAPALGSYRQDDSDKFIK